MRIYLKFSSDIEAFNLKKFCSNPMDNCVYLRVMRHFKTTTNNDRN